MRNKKIRKIQTTYSIYIVIFSLLTLLMVFIAIKTPKIVTDIFHSFVDDAGPGVGFNGFLAIVFDFFIILFVLILNVVVIETLIVSIIGLVKISKSTKKADMVKFAKWEVRNKICRIPGNLTLSTTDEDYSMICE